MEKVTDEFQATVLDLLCIDGVKALMKIPICALKPVHEWIAYRQGEHLKTFPSRAFSHSLEQLVAEIREEATSFSCQTSMRAFIKLYAEFGSSKHSGISRRLLIDL